MGQVAVGVAADQGAISGAQFGDSTLELGVGAVHQDPFTEVAVHHAVTFVVEAAVSIKAHHHHLTVRLLPRVFLFLLLLIKTSGGPPQGWYDHGGYGYGGGYNQGPPRGGQGGGFNRGGPPRGGNFNRGGGNRGGGRGQNRGRGHNRGQNRTRPY